MTGVHEQGVANTVESVRLFYSPVNLHTPFLDVPTAALGFLSRSDSTATISVSLVQPPTDSGDPAIWRNDDLGENA
jgi:hypothetical protein